MAGMLVPPRGQIYLLEEVGETTKFQSMRTTVSLATLPHLTSSALRIATRLSGVRLINTAP